MSCEYYDALRDYALDELPAAERREVESHLGSCAECTGELQALRLTTAALKILPDREIPQRIAFVSDKVFSPSPVARFFSGFWNSAAKLGFVSAVLLSGAITFSAMRRPAEVRSVVPVSVAADSRQIDEAVRQAVARVREEDARNARVALNEVERKYDEKQRALMVSVQENFEVLQKRLSSYTMLASSDAARINGQ